MKLKGIELIGTYKVRYGTTSLEVYNKKGYIIYYENNSDFWAKWERDEKDNMIYYESNNGYWEESEYDEIGNVIYYEDSDGKIIGERTKELTVEQIEKLLGYNIKIKK